MERQFNGLTPMEGTASLPFTEARLLWGWWAFTPTGGKWLSANGVNRLPITRSDVAFTPRIRGKDSEGKEGLLPGDVSDINLLKTHKKHKLVRNNNKTGPELLLDYRSHTTY